jgi:hypothetical protein
MMKKLKKTMQGSQYARRAVLAFACWFSMPASAATVYPLNDFQTAVGSGWSSADNTIGITQAPNDDFVRKFLGEFSNGTVSLSLTGLPVHATTTVSFSLYLIRSWDGNATDDEGVPIGPDYWNLSVGGGPTLLNTTFSNGGTVGQAYAPNPFAAGCTGYNLSGLPAGEYNPMTGASECYSLGYTFSSPDVTEESMDSVYNLNFTFAHNASDLVLNFSAAGLQGIADESWGLDNVRVDVSAVPVPAAAWLFGSGLLGLIGVARRKRVGANLGNGGLIAHRATRMHW